MIDTEGLRNRHGDGEKDVAWPWKVDGFNHEEWMWRNCCEALGKNPCVA
jgi:hypothetical protein